MAIVIEGPRTSAGWWGSGVNDILAWFGFLRNGKRSEGKIEEQFLSPIIARVNTIIICLSASEL
jgi:hypothetical protein